MTGLEDLLTGDLGPITQSPEAEEMDGVEMVDMGRLTAPTTLDPRFNQSVPKGAMVAAKARIVAMVSHNMHLFVALDDGRLIKSAQHRIGDSWTEVPYDG